MTDAEKLTMLKVDLGISVEAYDTRLTQYIQTSKNEIKREGISLSDDSLDDCTLIVMFAAWLWRKRDTGEGMPRMLRYALNNRLFAEKMQVGE